MLQPDVTSKLDPGPGRLIIRLSTIYCASPETDH